ncbi:Beta-galactosidase 8 [Citrus sinensis]|uniref:Beta-galactosidase 8 n=1 Tax=Citrus sinensis TaxID=2711 RepID=A0ACB8NFJ0_CITSI|nr:Beta-galactosidase 8 [Citrus sinensis]
MGMLKNFIACVLLVVLFLQNSCFEAGLSANVTYDHRALVIDGKRRVLQSGSIHYPRSTPEVWPELIRKSKEGGLEVIETYVFWNYHEPIRGQYYFEGRFDLVRFVKTVQEAGLFLHLRIGPYACAEWNYGGFPVWLHFIPGIQFRTTNNPFKEEMKRFLAKIIDLMKQENLFASQGGPIILAQVENEYGNVEWAYGVGGELYVKWAADTAVNLNTSVPWVMCQQEDAPDPIINTCNGFYCDGFTPNSPSKPIMWTENYSGWFLSFGYAVPFRPVEDLAFAVARFFETGGTFQNYYMYFGGTNFGRTAGGPLVATSYDYDAPIDEYGFIRQPKWGHLRELHKAIKLCEEYLISSDPTHQKLGAKLEAHIYHKSSNDCAAFLANYDSSSDANVTFNGNVYFLPAWSVSILPDCKNVVFNTAKVISQRNNGDHPFAQQKNVNELLLASSAFSWYEEKVGISGNRSFVRPDLAEQINTTKDTSDYLWYTASIHVMPGQGKEVFLNIESLGHAALVFVNKKLVAFGYGNHDFANFLINKKIELNEGINTLDILSMMVGLQVTKTTFLAPEGKGPLALNLASMGKGQAWVNGQSIGRYWSAYLAPSTGCTKKCDYRGSYDASKCQKHCGQPAQTLYHIPRTWVHPGENLLVIHEELGGDPSKISLLTKTGQHICSFVSEADPPPVDSWKPNLGVVSSSPQVRLACERGWHIAAINFASYGIPEGNCGSFRPGACHMDVLPIVQKACVGQIECSIPVSSAYLGVSAGACPGLLKALAVEAHCSI